MDEVLSRERAVLNSEAEKSSNLSICFTFTVLVERQQQQHAALDFPTLLPKEAVFYTAVLRMCRGLITSKYHSRL